MMIPYTGIKHPGLSSGGDMWRKERCNVLFFCGVKVFLTVPACGGFGRPCRFAAKGARGGGIRYSCQRSWALSIRGGVALMGGWMRSVELPLIGGVAYRPLEERDFALILGARTIFLH